MNFFKKHETTIYAVIIFVIIISVGIFLGINDDKQEQKSLSKHHEGLEDNEEPKQPSRTKPDTQTPKSKIQITQEDFEKIKTYILSENKDTTLTLTLSQEETTEINKIKQNLINYNKDCQSQSQSWINEYQQECDDYNEKINKLNPEDSYDKIKIKSLNEQLSHTEELKNDCIGGLHRRLEQNKLSSLNDLNSLYEITSNEK